MAKEILMIAGSNGAGKTTFARRMLPAFDAGMQFLNADEIQREIGPTRHLMAAGRKMLRRMDELVAFGKSFSVETTLSSTMYVRRIKKWKTLGYRITLHFIETPSADFSVKRVAARVAAGGHDIPETDIRRRFHRGLRLFHETYKPLVDGWYHWHTTDGGTHLVERYET